MGYYSTFDIIAHEDELTKQIKDRLEVISDYAFDLSNGEISSCDEYKWYECDNDMTQLSREFPTVLFSLDWIGEDNDRGRTYYLNGRSQAGKVKITYSDPDMDKLRGIN